MKPGDINVTSTLVGIKIGSQPITNITDLAAKSLPFDSYYEEKLVAAGWTEDKILPLAAPEPEVTGYRKGSEYIVLEYTSVFKNMPVDNPEMCPCDMTFSIFAGSQNRYRGLMAVPNAKRIRTCRSVELPCLIWSFATDYRWVYADRDMNSLKVIKKYDKNYAFLICCGYCRCVVDSRRSRRGYPVLQEPVLGTADGERGICFLIGAFLLRFLIHEPARVVNSFKTKALRNRSFWISALPGLVPPPLRQLSCVLVCL